MLLPIAEIANDPQLPAAMQVPTLLVMLALPSLMLALLYAVISYFKLGRVFRCIPLIVLRGKSLGEDLASRLGAISSRSRRHA